MKNIILALAALFLFGCNKKVDTETTSEMTLEMNDAGEYEFPEELKEGFAELDFNKVMFKRFDFFIEQIKERDKQIYELKYSGEVTKVSHTAAVQSYNNIVRVQQVLTDSLNMDGVPLERKEMFRNAINQNIGRLEILSELLPRKSNQK